MRLTAFNIDEVARGLPEITNHKILENRKFAKDGLFSQQIFGPVKSYTCACSKFNYKGKRYDKEKCPICNVPIVSSEVRKKKYAKIVLPFEVLNPFFYYVLASKRSAVKKVINEMLGYYGVYRINEKDSKIEKVDPDEIAAQVEESEISDEKLELLRGLNGVTIYIKWLLNKHKEEAESKGKPLKKEYEYLLNNLDSISIKHVLVIPPEFRPCGKLNSGDYISDDINKIYQQILRISSQLKNIPYKISHTESVYTINFKYLQDQVIELYDYVLSKMSKKSGLIRSNILGKRVDFSSRSVISPDATLKLDECRLPYWMVLEMMKPQLISHFVNRRICKRSNRAIKLIDESIQNNDSKYFDIVREFCKGKICVLNRQPTLHRLSVLAFKFDVHLGNTIQIHPMVCPPYNADFDGDAMACYIGLTEEAEKDIFQHIGIWNNLVSPTDMSSVPKPNQDIILGVYAATKDYS